jgi:transcriptional regulator with XRE-family HTH domain
MASTLILQLADRTSAFLRHAGISQNQLCEHLSISKSSLSQFLNGTKGLDPSTVIKLCQALSLSHAEVAAKFSAPARTSRSLSLQESTEGRPAQMRLDGNSDGAWVPGLSGDDPYSPANTIVDPGDAPDGPTAEDLALLRNLRALHRQGIKAINGFIRSIPNRASVNRSGTTEPTLLPPLII